ncbi:MAG TPA: DUF4084 domain-containing protein [Planococcus sp. (in: firmicutes)]|nr:DUF4084 domain-containing protein [Planococcus sp. (in: firmicutes)]
MDMRTKKRLGMAIVLLYTMVYYFWLVGWQGNLTMQSLGGNLLSITGIGIAFVWLLQAFKRSEQKEKGFWLLLALGGLSYLVAELIWLAYDSILGQEVPFPGSPDLFYMLQIIFFLAAFVYKFMHQNRTYEFVRFLFDILIVMTVAATFSWYFIIEPILDYGAVSSFELMVSLAYPIGDLALLLAVITLYFSNQKTQLNGLYIFIFLGISVQIIADTAYLYLISMDGYAAGSLIDPLFILAILLIGFTGFIYQGELKSETEEISEASQLRKVDVFQLAFPYIGVAILFIFMGSRTNEVDVITIGSGLSIFLVIIRQILMILENQRLLRQYHTKTEELEISEQRYKSLFENHPDAVYSLDLKGRFESINAAGAKLLSYEEKDLIGLASNSFTDIDHQQRVLEHVYKVMKGTPQHYEIPVHDRNGKTLQMSITNIPIVVKNNVVGIFGIGKDITENKLNEERVNHMAYHDALTDLANRALFDDLLRQAVMDAKSSTAVFAVMFIDLDQFKKVNDTLGHDIGDLLLISVANRLKDAVSTEDIVARQGGDEFAVLLHSIRNQEEALQTAQAILGSLSQPHLVDGYEIISTPSIGIAMYPFDAQSAGGLMKKADTAMYQVKQSGKGHFQLPN